MEQKCLAKLLLKKRFSQLICLLIFFFAMTPWVQAKDVRLAWDPNHPSPASYRLFLRTSGQSYDYSNWIYQGTEPACIITNLDPNTTYFFVVRSYVGQDVSGDSNEVSYTTVGDPFLGANPNTDRNTVVDSGTQHDSNTNSTNTPDTGQNGGSEIWIEAEDGNLSGTMVAAADKQASGGQYLWSAATRGRGFAEFSFTIEDPGDYTIWGLVSAATKGSNSFFISLDNGPREIWDLPVSSPWIWDQYSARGEAVPTIVFLSAGTHTLRISRREKKSKIDQIVITNDLATTPE